MNREKIIRMAQEAGAMEHFVHESDEIPFALEFSLTNLEHFANAIIKECIDIVPWQYEAKIKQHFGVE